MLLRRSRILRPGPGPEVRPEPNKPPQPSIRAEIPVRLPPQRLLAPGRPVRSTSQPQKTPGARDRSVRGATKVRMDLLLEEVEVVQSAGDVASVEVTSVELDSRQVGPGALFCCLPGA